MTSGSLVLDRAIEVQRRLLAAGIDSALGGALALAYHVDDPRGTQEIDVNVAFPAARAVEALRVLPADVPWDDDTIARIERDGQVRIMWPVPGEMPMPLDLFFAVDEFHEVARGRAIEVPMRDATVRVLSATDLTVFKALFDRSKDWPDIEAMLAAHDSTVDLDDAIRWVGSIVGAQDPRVARLRSLGGAGHRR